MPEAILPVLVPILGEGGAILALSYTSYALTAAAVVHGARQASRQRRNARDAYNNSLRDQMITLKGGVNARPIVYGRTAVGGQIIYAETTGTKKEHLLMVVALAHGEIDAIETVYFNDVALTIDGSDNVTNAPYYGGNAVTQVDQFTIGGAPYQVTLTHTPTGPLRVQDGFYGWTNNDNSSTTILTEGVDYTVSGTTVTFGAAYTSHPVQIAYEYAGTSTSYAKIIKYTGAAGQDISAVMAGLGAPSWTANDKCEGMALLIVRLTYGEDIWPTGIPNIKAVVRGRKVYDPRSGLTVWSNNAALCARDYLRLQYGVNVANSKVDDTATIAAANICDEQVQLTATPTYQARYTVNGVLSTGDDRLSNLELLEQAMAGSINYSQGTWRIRAGAYTAPALTLDESKLADAGAISIVPFASRRDLINGCKGTYVNGDAGYIEDQFPEWSSATFIAEDGAVALTKTVALPLVTDTSRAQRLAKIAVYRERERLTLACSCNFSTYTWQVGDMVAVTISRYGFSAKPFRIVERGFSVEGAMRYVLREEPNGIYDWNLGEASILAGAANTSLPDPTAVLPPTITGVASAGYVYKTGDGTFVARILVSVTPPDDEYVLKGGKLQLRYRRGDWFSTDEWVLIEADGNASAIWIDPAFDRQNYLIQVRAVNSAGYASPWTAPVAHLCLGRAGDVANMLKNANWEEDLGYGSTNYPDSRALRHWSYGTNLVGFTPAIGRNYVDGTAWNIGIGGAWMYQGLPQPGAVQYIYQVVPATAGVEYEASVYVSPHRATAQMLLAFNVPGTGLVYAPSDLIDPGAAEIIGTATDPVGTHYRAWTKGTAPAGTTQAYLILVKGDTAAGKTSSYAFWSRSMICVAPSGVTRETATPWVPSEASTFRGLSEPVESTGAGHASWDSIIGASHNFRTYGATTSISVAIKAGAKILIDVNYQGQPNVIATPTEANVAIDLVVSGSGKTAWHTDASDSTGNLVSNSTSWQCTTVVSSISTMVQSTYTAPSDQTITVYGGGGARLGGSTGVGTVRLRIQQVKA